MRTPLRPYVALLLLLCLLRTLLPEAYVIALHAHQHTTEEPAFAPGKYSSGKLFTPKHTHCQAAQFYNIPFQGALPVAVPLPLTQPNYRPLAMPPTLVCLAARLRRTALRGPPRA